MQGLDGARWWDDVREGGPPPLPEGWEPEPWDASGWDVERWDVQRWDLDDRRREVDPDDATAWAAPGVPFPRAPGPVLLPPDVAELLAAVQRVQSADPVLLEGRAALERARLLMSCIERLGAAVLPAVRDVEDRGLWQHAAASSTRGWLRTLPAGEGSWANSAGLLGRRPHLSAALADGRIALRTARAVASALEQVPADVADEQVQAVATDGARMLLSVWLGAGCLTPTDAQQAEFDARRARLDAAVALGAQLPDDPPWVVLPDARLEPVLTLLAEVLAPGEVPAAIGWLLDALLPERVEERERRERDRRGLVLLRSLDGGWVVRGHLTEEVGQRLYDLLRAYRWCTRAQEVPDAALLDLATALFEGEAARSGSPTVDLTAADIPSTGEDLPFGSPTGAEQDRVPFGPLADPSASFGGVGPGDPALLPPPPEHPWEEQPDQPLLGDPPATPDQRRHDAFAALLLAVSGLPPGPGRPAPARLLVTADLPTLQGQSASLPATLDGAHGPVALSRARLAELGCSSRLVAVLTDAAGRPVGASREERDASQAQRDALRAVWGDRCAGFGCPNRGTVPHHVKMHSVHGETVLSDLVPFCEGDHHVVHDGKHALRLRDGRVLDENGWVS